MIQFLIMFYLSSQVFLLWLIKKAQERCKYTTACCHDVRASMGMFAYRTEVEAKRNHLNRLDSKF